MTKKIFLSILAFISVISCKSQVRSDSIWTKAYEQREYKQLDDVLISKLPDEEKRKQFLSYIISRLKTELPNGVESVSIDSLRKLSAKIGEEYGYAHAGDRNSGLIPTAMLWTPELEKTLRKAITYGAKNEADIKLYNKLCDCLLIKLKKMNPDSVLMPLPHDVAVKVVGECRSEILGNKP